MNTPYRALIVDFGGVLTTPLHQSMAEFADAVGVELQDLVRAALAAYSGADDALVVGFETGRIPEEEFAVELAARLSEACGRPLEPQGLLDRLLGSMKLEEEMLHAVAAARGAGLKTALLSNSWGLGRYPREQLERLFDVVVISGEVGMRKPDPDIYRLVTERLGVRPSECVFVDDFPGHLKAGLEAGMTTVLHRSPEETVTELEALLAVPLAP